MKKKASMFYLLFAASAGMLLQASGVADRQAGLNSEPYDCCFVELSDGQSYYGDIMGEKFTVKGQGSYREYALKDVIAFSRDPINGVQLSLSSWHGSVILIGVEVRDPNLQLKLAEDGSEIELPWNEIVQLQMTHLPHSQSSQQERLLDLGGEDWLSPIQMAYDFSGDLKVASINADQLERAPEPGQEVALADANLFFPKPKSEADETQVDYREEFAADFIRHLLK